jgi:hypothetical protein
MYPSNFALLSALPYTALHFTSLPFTTLLHDFQPTLFFFNLGEEKKFLNLTAGKK